MESIATSELAKPCLVYVWICRRFKKEGFSDTTAGYLAGNLIEAMTQAHSTTLSAFIQTMIIFQEVKEKVQGGIGCVVVPDRTPMMDDEPNLQYIRACVKHPVIHNVYSINMDPERYPDPRCLRSQSIQE
jgi:hypothetical protein